MDAILQWWKSRTNKAVVIGVLITAIDANSGVISGMVPLAYRPYLLMVWPVAMAYFRSITVEPVSAK